MIGGVFPESRIEFYVMKNNQFSMSCGFMSADKPMNDHAAVLHRKRRGSNVSDNGCCRNCNVSNGTFEIEELSHTS